MTDIADRVEIQALSGEFADAVLMRDYDRFAALFTRDGVWRMPYPDMHFTGREEIRVWVERLQSNWEFFVQNIHPGYLRVDGDTAIGRVFVEELGRFTNSGSHRNHAVYHDKYLRTADGWRFTERSYQLRYVDETPLPGSAP